MDATRVLEKLGELGFRFPTLARYERQIAAERGGFVALLEYTPAGEIRQFSSTGYLVEGHIGLLIWRGRTGYFVAKRKEVLATPELLKQYRQFQQDLTSVLGTPGRR